MSFVTSVFYLLYYVLKIYTFQVANGISAGKSQCLTFLLVIDRGGCDGNM